VELKDILEADLRGELGEAGTKAATQAATAAQALGAPARLGGGGRLHGGLAACVAASPSSRRRPL